LDGRRRITGERGNRVRNLCGEVVCPPPRCYASAVNVPEKNIEKLRSAFSLFALSADAAVGQTSISLWSTSGADVAAEKHIARRSWFYPGAASGVCRSDSEFTSFQRVRRRAFGAKGIVANVVFSTAERLLGAGAGTKERLGQERTSRNYRRFMGALHRTAGTPILFMAWRAELT
jgi:hypothetical protein